MAEAELAEAGLLAARQHGAAAVAAATRLGMKYQLMYALLASARVAAAAGDLGRAHDDACQALITGLGIRLCLCRPKEQPDRVKPRLAVRRRRLRWPLPLARRSDSGARNVITRSPR
jgi:hypothetical protein